MSECCKNKISVLDSPIRQDELWEFYEKIALMAQSIPVPIKINKIRPDAKGLFKKRPSDVAWDIHCVADDNWPKVEAIISSTREQSVGEPYLILYPGESYTFRTGIKVAMPSNYGMVIKDRSSIGGKDIIVGAGVIEGTYRDEWNVHLINVGTNAHEFHPGDRIAQGIVTPIVYCETYDCDDLPPSDRGTDGWGSSGR